MNQEEYLSILIKKYEGLYETTIKLVSVVDSYGFITRVYKCGRPGVISNLELRLISWQIRNLKCCCKPIRCGEEL